MTAEEWTRVKTIFQEALDWTPAERALRLAAACGTETDLRRAVDRLLAAHESAAAFLDGPCRIESGGMDDASPAPSQIGSYRIVRELGRGGMGTVYLAERDDPNLRRSVAIKVVNVASRFIVSRFRTETEVLAALEHAGVARLYDAGTTDGGVPYFVMEYVAGDDLLRYSDVKRATLAERLRLFQRVCAAVQYAHQNFVVHRDLKPSNILVTAEGEPKLLDFGIAKLLSAPDQAVEETAWFLRVMTPQYSSPEHIRGERVTTASDVYSLGVILYELLSGGRPYRLSSRTTAEIEKAVCEQEPLPPSASVPGDADIAAARAMTTDSLRRRLKGDLDTIVLKALQKEPAFRYATASELADDIQRWLDGYPVLAQPGTKIYRAAKFLRRHKTSASAAAIAALSLMIGLAFASWQAHVARIERDHARVETDKARQMASFLAGIFQSANPAATREKNVTAHDLLDRGTDSIMSGLQASPEVQASLLLVMSNAYYRTDDVPKALALAEKALEIRRRIFPADHTDVADAMFEVAGLQRRSGKPKESLALLEQALAIREKRLGPNDPSLTQILNGLGLAQEKLGQLDRATATLQRAVTIGERSFPRTARLALIYNNLATMLHRHGDLEQARGMYERSIEHYKASNEPQNWGLAMPLVNLGSLQRDNENFEAAEPLFEQALAIDEARFGRDSLGSAYSLGCLGDLARARGDFARAHELLERSLALYAKAGPEYTDGDDPERYLGETFLDEGRVADAVPHFERAIRLSERSHGKKHQAVAMNLAALARARIAENAWTEADSMLQRALAIDREVLPAGHRELIPILTLLGRLRAHQHRADEADRLLAEALKVAEQLPPHHSFRIAAQKTQQEVSLTADSRQ